MFQRTGCISGSSNLVVDVSYVSYLQGSVPEGDSIEVRNLSRSLLVGAPMFDGGVDPIPITASVGDQLQIAIFGQGVANRVELRAVPERNPPIVVRTFPPRRGPRVPLNIRVQVIFSEPVLPLTVTGQTIRLLVNGQPVPATVSPSSDGLSAELVPNQPLLPGTMYLISVSTEVRDLAGDPFALEYTSDFTTVDPPPAVGTIVFWANERNPLPPQGDGGLRNNIYKMNADGTGVEALAQHFNGTMESPTLSPDGQLIAFANGGWLILMQVNGTGLRALVQAGDYVTRPAWSPDGSRIAFAGTRDDPANRDIYVVNVDGTGVSRLTTDLAADERPSWSPDGNRIVFASYRGGNWDLYIMNADGSNTTRLTTHPAADWTPSWSPDGTRIAFHSRRDGNLEVYLIDADGTNVVRLTDDSAYDESPAWSPDGTRIVFYSGRGGGEGGLHAMNPDGTGLVWLTSGIHRDPNWGP